MTFHWLSAPVWFEGLLTVSLQAAILAAVVMILRLLFRRRLAAKWTHLLFVLVLVRLSMPGLPASPTSVFNLLPEALPAAPAAGPAAAEGHATGAVPPAVSEAWARLSFPIGSPGPNGASPSTVPVQTPAANAPAIRPLDIAFGVWAVVLAVLAGRLLLQNVWFLRRLARERGGCPDAVLALVADCGASLGLRRRVRVRCTEQVHTPAVYGLLRPTLLLPAGTVERLDSEDLRFVILHELVHIRRHDLWINAWCVTLNAIHWFNPVLAVAFRRMRHDRELATDAAVLDALGDHRRRAYGEAILRLLDAARPATSLPGLVGILETHRQLRDRIRRIGAYRPLQRISLLGLGLTAALAATTLTNAVGPEEAAPPAAAESARAADAFRLRVMDELTGAPIPGAQVLSVTPTLTGDEFARIRGETDANGICVLRPPDGLKLFATPFTRIGVVGDGYPATELTRLQLDPPAEFTLRLARGVPIGGTVTDPAGNPVTGAAVHVDIRGGSKQISPDAVEWKPGSPERAFHMETTDRDGRWTCGHVPKDVRDLRIHLRHPDFAEVIYTPFQTHQLPNTDYAPVQYDDLVSGTARFRLGPGVALQGRVTDSDGTPVAEADVAIGNSWPEDPYYIRPTDGDGRFQFRLRARRKAILIAKAKGYSPERVSVTEEDVTAPIEMRLGPPARIAGRVVDPAGNAVPGTFVVGGSSVTGSGLQWLQESGPDGAFALTDVPLGKRFSFGLFHPEYVAQEAEYEVMEAQMDVTVTLRPPARIEGVVVDGDTGERIPAFTAVPGYTTSPRWSHSFTRVGSNGYFALTYVEPDPPFSLRIDAEGYEPFVSPMWADQEAIPAEIRVDIHRLPPIDTRPVDGQAVLPDGDPAAGGQVMMTTSKKFSFASALTSGGFARDFTSAEDARFAEMDEQGRFRFDPLRDAAQVFVWHPRGFGHAGIEAVRKSGTIQLQPWSRLEGRILNGTEPGAGWSLSINHHGTLTTLTMGNHEAILSDETGRFAVERVPPGRASVTAWKPVRMDGTRQTPVGRQVHVLFEPGRTATLDFGVEGRMVVGRATRPAGVSETDWPNLMQHMVARIEVPQTRVHYPEGLSPEEQTAWYREYMDHGEGLRDYLAAQWHSTTLNPDGSFRIPGIQAGDYQLEIQPPGRDYARAEGLPLLNTTRRDITIPESTRPGSGEIFDVGDIPVVARLGPDMPMPTFEVATLHGDTARSADYRGRILLLDCWATWCGPCIAEIPNLKAVHAEFGDDPRFAMLGLSWDREEAPLREYAAKEGLGWEQAWLSENQRTDLANRFDVEGIPALFLIGPDGIIIARDLRGPAIREAVATALRDDAE